MANAYGICRNRCPRCGGKIIVSYLHQYSLDFPVTKKGVLSKKYRRIDNGPEEACVASCENINSGCDVYWGQKDFEVQSGRFVDFKYDENREETPE